MGTEAMKNIDAIIAKLSEGDTRRIDKLIEELNEANCSAKNQRLFGFTYLGYRYIPRKFSGLSSAIAKTALPTLPPDRMEDAAYLLQEQKRLEGDMQKIRQALAPLVMNATTVQELRDSLPECIVRLFPELAKLDRHLQSPTSLIRSNKYAIKAYENVLPMIEAYSVTSLVM